MGRGRARMTYEMRETILIREFTCLVFSGIVLMAE
jgi:hypothetical protein